MKRLAALLLLSACGSQDSAEPASEAEGSAPPAAAAAAAQNLSADHAGLQAEVDRAMAAVLQEPDGARYRAVRRGLAGTICGEVDPQRKGGGHDGFRPFLVSPEGAARVATSPRLSFEDPSDTFPDYYIRWCASPEELKRLEPELRRAIAAASAGAPAVPLADLAGPDPDSAGPVSPALPPPPGQGAATVPPADLDSFAKSVRRKPDQPSGK